MNKERYLVWKYWDTLTEDVNNRIPVTLGTPMVLNNTWDLHTLPVGKYYRQSQVSSVNNIPAGLTAAFFCVVENTISSNRRRITLYPCTTATAGEFYTCLETSTGFSPWYKFTGTVVS